MYLPAMGTTARQIGRRCLLLHGALFLASIAGGCQLRDLLQPRAARLPPTAEPTAEAAALEVSALPVYRLIPAGEPLDAPARLLVLQVRVTDASDEPLALTADDFDLVLPGGQHGRTFDRPRAIELLRRTRLADLDLPSLQQGATAPPGGLPEAARAALSDAIAGDLVHEAVIAQNSVLSGYVIIDTRLAVTSLAGATLSVTAHRVSDTTAVTAAYRFEPPTPREGA
jgi:hypothetical protein